ncbi:MAG: PleD family two-component system response regulator [Alphaproteobacteria bacterium]
MTGLVLIVDDVPANVRLLEAKLTAEYYSIISAYDGEETLRQVREAAPDVVLLDVMMPGMDGFEVCERIKADPATSHIPVVMVTALSDRADRLRGLEVGADDFLTKPVRDEALFSRLKSLIRFKQTMDEWRVREESFGQFGGSEELAKMRDLGIRGARVLAVDEYDEARAHLCEIFAQAGADIESAKGNDEAFARLAQADYDLLVVGSVEGGGAVRFCSQLRARPESRSVPIIVIGNEQMQEELFKALDLGVNDYVVRPLDRAELTARAKTQVARHKYHRWLKDGYARSLDLALTDPLTGVYNRRYFEVHLEKKLAQMRPGSSLGLIFMDIDSFKQINDSQGHAVGDRVLMEVARILRERVREFDMVARLGGDEFVVVTPDMSEDLLLRVTDRLCEAIRGLAIEPVKPGQASLAITMSVGAALTEAAAVSPVELLGLADTAMYQAKFAGGNCVRIETVSAGRPHGGGSGDAAAAR